MEPLRTSNVAMAAKNVQQDLHIFKKGVEAQDTRKTRNILKN
jgi:hypothetical protein